MIMIVLIVDSIGISHDNPLANVHAYYRDDNTTTCNNKENGIVINNKTTSTPTSIKIMENLIL